MKFQAVTHKSSVILSTDQESHHKILNTLSNANMNLQNELLYVTNDQYLIHLGIVQ